MKFIAIIFVLVLLSFNINAQQNVIYGGDVATLKMIRDIFPDSLPVAKSGGEGVIAFNELATTPKSVYISITSTAIVAGLFDKQFENASKFRIIAILTNQTVGLLASANSKYNTLDEMVLDKKQIVLGGIGAKSTCFLIGKQIEKHYKISVLYIPYKTPNTIDIDLANNTLDLSCRVGLKLAQGYSTGLVKPISNLSRTHMNFDFKVPNAKFVIPEFANYLFASNDLTDEEIAEIRKKIKNYANKEDTKRKYEEEHSTFVGIVEQKDVQRFFNSQRTNWLNIMKEVK